MTTALDIPALFKSLLKKLGSDVIAIDTEGRIVLWERGFAIGGLTTEDRVGQLLLDVFPQLGSADGDIDWNLEIFTHVLKEGREVEVRRQPRPVGNRTLWFDILAWPVFAEDGETILGATLVSIDVSERHALEEELTRTARTQSLANLGASIAHEIRNPLNAMGLNLQLVREGIVDPEKATTEQQVNDLDLALAEIRRLDEIVGNFLTFARPPQATMSLDDPTQAIESVIAMLKEKARRKGVELVNACSPVPKVLMDRNRIIEALFNLAQNAVQALSKGGTVTLSADVEADAVVLKVIDDGPGIPAEMQPKIFELYFSTKEEDGTGLGLPYADSIVKAHNGKLSLHSKIGEGSTFEIRLPRSIQA